MAGSGSKKVIYAALVGNGLIAVTKYAAAAYTGSSAMFSEAIHSTVDSGNQVLLLLGMKRAKRPPDARHPFGYGPEIYFWAFVVAILIFSLGAGISIYEGIQKLLHPHPMTNPTINYIVLGLAMIFEAGAWWVAYKEFQNTKGKRGYLDAIRVSKDPSVFTVLLEDTAAMLGLIVAFVGIAAGQMLGIAELDGLASIVIGLILAATAVLLAVETKGLLIGEGADPDLVTAVRGLVMTSPNVAGINEALTMHLGPREVLLTLSLDFANSLSAGDVERSVSELEVQIKRAHPEIRRVFIEAQDWSGHLKSRDGGTAVPAPEGSPPKKRDPDLS
jgi:cation diffusion facilitator family transporter